MATTARNKGIPNVRSLFQRAGSVVLVVATLSFGALGCRENAAQAPIVTNNSGPDPADANLATPGSAPAPLYGQSTNASRTRVLAQSAGYAPQQSSESYPAGQQAPAPIVRGNTSSQNESLNYNTQPPVTENGQAPQNYDPNAPTADPNYADSQENAGYEALEQTDQAPPPLPEYDQPPAPDDNYLWTPGYWGYSSAYYWVPGAWVAPPFYGALWTPPYWGWYGGRYLFHRGYWGNHIGYYGGIDYGFGYVGTGFYGGYWQGRNFYYNRAVTNVNVASVRNVYNRTVIVNNVNYGARPENRTSFNGGPGGIRMQPRPAELAAMHEPHYAPVPAQVQSRQMAATNRAQFFNQNHGQPAEAFHGRPLSSTAAIAATPGRPAVNGPAPNQGQPAAFNRMQPGQPVQTQQQREGFNQQRNVQQQPPQQQREAQQVQQIQQQRSPQPQPQPEQQRTPHFQSQEQQRTLQMQQQQQRQAADQQRQAADQQRTQQFQQQQRQAADQQRAQQQLQQGQHTQQLQQQQQQRAAEVQRAPQQPQVRPQPQQHMEAPRPVPQAPAPHAASAGGGHEHQR